MTNKSTKNLLWLHEIPYNTQFSDSYYSYHGGFDESQHVYVNGVELPRYAAQGQDCTLAELGFGTGLNFLASVLAWQEAPNHLPAKGKLHYIALEKWPLTRKELQRAWQKFPSLQAITSHAANILAPLASGFQRLWWSHNIVLDLWVGDVAAILPYWSYPVDAWYLDGFAPSRNPDMFNDTVLNHVQRLSHRNSMLASFTVAGAVRRGLSARGFSVNKRTGFAGKTHCLQARATALPHKKPAVPSRIAVIGAGIAGSCVVQQLKFFAPHTQITLLNAGQSASQVPLAAVAPRFSATLSPRGQLMALSLRHARQFYDVFASTAWVGQAGAMKLPSPALDQARLQRAVNSWHDWGASMCTPAQATARAGVDITTPTQWLQDGGIIDTKILLHILQKTSDKIVSAKITRLERVNSAAYWHLHGNHVLANTSEAFSLEVDQVVIAGGVGSLALCPTLAAHARIKPATVAYCATTQPTPRCALGGWGGHALSTATGDGFWYATTMQDTTQKVANTQPVPPMPAALQRWGYRPLHPMPTWSGEKLSINGHTPIADIFTAAQDYSWEGIAVLTGAGGHGFTMMPLLATRLVSRLLGHIHDYPGEICKLSRQ